MAGNRDGEYEAAQRLKRQVDDLLRVTPHTKNLIQDGRVFVEHNGRHGKIDFEGFQLFVHFLRRQTQPLHATILPMSEVVPLAPPCQVFLDLQWPDNGHRGRVIIDLVNNSLGQQFKMLCTGEMGPCYANTPLLGLQNKGSEGERVLGGYHLGVDEREGAQLPQLDKKNTSKPYWEGDVLARTVDGALGTYFAILTKSLVRQSQNRCVFGKVKFGLDVVKHAAAKCNNITDIVVVDCGVVLPVKTE